MSSSAIPIKVGGQLERVGGTTLKELRIYKEGDSNAIQFWINGASLTYLSVQEAKQIMNALELAIYPNGLKYKVLCRFNDGTTAETIIHARSSVAAVELVKKRIFANEYIPILVEQ